MRNNGWSVAYMDGVYLWVVSSYLLFNDLRMEKYGIFEHYYTKLFFLSFLFLHLERLRSTQNQSVACLLSVLFHFCYSESEMLEFYSRDFNYAEEFPSQCFMYIHYRRRLCETCGYGAVSLITKHCSCVLSLGTIRGIFCSLC